MLGWLDTVPSPGEVCHKHWVCRLVVRVCPLVLSFQESVVYIPCPKPLGESNLLWETVGQPARCSTVLPPPRGIDLNASVDMLRIQSFPMTANFGGCSPPPMWDRQGEGAETLPKLPQTPAQT